MDSKDAPICDLVLSELNDTKNPKQRYTWLSPPNWTPPIVPVRWSLIDRDDRTEVLKAINDARCASFCSEGLPYWQSKIGIEVFESKVQDETYGLTASVALVPGAASQQIFRLHELHKENFPLIAESLKLNSEFFLVTATAPLKLVALQSLRKYADIIEINGDAYFYRYDSRFVDNRWRTLRSDQPVIEVGRYNPQYGIVQICEMAHSQAAASSNAKN